MPKESSKFHVISKKKSVKKKRFKGTSKWEIEAQKRQPKDTITFIDETCVKNNFTDASTQTLEDVPYAEPVVIPRVSPSRRKIQPTKSVDSESYSKQKATGYRLISMDSLEEFVTRLHNIDGCSGVVSILEDDTNRFGFCSSLFASCSQCDLNEFLSTGKHNLTDEVPRTIQGKDINRRIVFAASEMGVNRESLCTLATILNMPPPPVKSTWQDHEAALYESHRRLAEKELEKNRDELYEYLMEDSNLEEENPVLDTTVSFDGTWSKRGFTANHGIGFAISADTGRVLDYEHVSKICKQCEYKKANLSQEVFETWYESHTCLGNYKGSSPSMEVACAKEIWIRSKNYKMRFRYMLSDGDAKTYNVVWDIYMVCNICEKYENMPKTSEEYKQWKISQDYKDWEESHADGTADCERVIKVDCIGHIQKRMGKALLKFVNEKKAECAVNPNTGKKGKFKMEDGKPIQGQSGRLTKTAIEKLQKHYGNAIRNNTSPDASSKEEKDKSVKAMQREIKAGLFHCIKSIPDNIRHQYCPASWCNFKKGKQVKDKAYYLDPVFLKHLEPTYDRLSQPALLERCLPGLTQNANESLNALVWDRCPKHKWYGNKRVEMAAISALLHFSNGDTAKQKLMEEAGLEIGEHTIRGIERRDAERIHSAERKSDENVKKRRAAIRVASKQTEEDLVLGEGETYGAGSFNDEDLTEVEPPRKKGKK